MQVAMGFVGNYAPCGLSPQMYDMPVILEKVPTLTEIGVGTSPDKSGYSARRGRDYFSPSFLAIEAGIASRCTTIFIVRPAT